MGVTVSLDRSPTSFVLGQTGRAGDGGEDPMLVTASLPGGALVVGPSRSGKGLAVAAAVLEWAGPVFVLDRADRPTTLAMARGRAAAGRKVFVSGGFEGEGFDRVDADDPAALGLVAEGRADMFVLYPVTETDDGRLSALAALPHTLSPKVPLLNVLREAGRFEIPEAVLSSMGAAGDGVHPVLVTHSRQSLAMWIGKDGLSRMLSETRVRLDVDPWDGTATATAGGVSMPVDLVDPWSRLDMMERVGPRPGGMRLPGGAKGGTGARLTGPQAEAMLRKVRAGMSVVAACAEFGISRMTFYRRSGKGQ